LSFKIIFTQKYQISISGKYLNLAEFENVFVLKLNFQFKSNLLKGIAKRISIFHAQSKVFWPKSCLAAHHFFPTPNQPNLLRPFWPNSLAHLARLGSSSTSCFRMKQPLPSVGATAPSVAAALQAAALTLLHLLVLPPLVPLPSVQYQGTKNVSPLKSIKQMPTTIRPSPSRPLLSFPSPIKGSSDPTIPCRTIPIAKSLSLSP
jgi:hypothetical protein